MFAKINENGNLQILLDNNLERQLANFAKYDNLQKYWSTMKMCKIWRNDLQRNYKVVHIKKGILRQFDYFAKIDNLQIANNDDHIIIYDDYHIITWTVFVLSEFGRFVQALVFAQFHLHHLYDKVSANVVTSTSSSVSENKHDTAARQLHTHNYFY